MSITFDKSHLKKTVTTVYVAILNLAALTVAVIAGFFITLENEYYDRRLEFIFNPESLQPHTSFYRLSFVVLFVIAIYEIFSLYRLDSLYKEKEWANKFLKFMFVFAIFLTIVWGIFIANMETRFNVSTGFMTMFIVFASIVALGSVALLRVSRYKIAKKDR